MKTIKRTALFIAIVAMTISCGKDAKKEEVKVITNETEAVPVKKETKEDLDATTESVTVVFADEKNNQVYAQYLAVKKALVNSDAIVVQKEAKKLDELFQEEEAYKELKATSKLIALTKDIKKQRDFFVTLTSETEKLITNAEITSGEVYKQFCPMAFEGKGGYWLSNSKEVRNPYYGIQMLKCGSVNSTIN